MQREPSQVCTQDLEMLRSGVGLPATVIILFPHDPL